MSFLNRYTLSGAFAAALALTPGILHEVEGTRYEVYTDVAGIPTVCEGITGSDVVPGKTYTRKECDQLLFKHIDVAKRAVDSSVRVTIPDTMRASLYSFAFNVGASGFKNSTLLKKLNRGDLRGACQEMFRWEYSTVNGKKKWVKGLHNRRVTEYGWCTKDLK